jgi:prolipoprotein diacylglyceryltransferase
LYPILLQLGDLVIPAWHTLYALAAVCSFFLLTHLVRKHDQQIPLRNVSNLFIVCYISGYFGSRFLSVVVDGLPQGPIAFMEAMLSLGPMTFYGGAVASALAGLAFAAWRRLPIEELLDSAVLAGLLALAIGRIGCHLNGDDYGIPVADQQNPPWWSVTFPNLQDGVARVPTQLLSTLVIGSYVGAMSYWFGAMRARFGPGAIGKLSITVYCVLRFIGEYWRADPRGTALWGSLSTSQFISIWILLTLGVWQLVARLGKTSAN